jgi:hypothetical protein
MIIELIDFGGISFYEARWGGMIGHGRTHFEAIKNVFNRWL